MTSQRDPEDHKPCIIMAEGLFATLYWAQFLKRDIKVVLCGSFGIIGTMQ